MENSQKIVEKTLFEITLKLLINRPRTITLPEIAAAIDVSQSWLNGIISGRIGDPGVNAVERLYSYLTGKPLQF